MAAAPSQLFTLAYLHIILLLYVIHPHLRHSIVSELAVSNMSTLEPTIRAVCVLMIVLTVIATGLRFTSRKLSGAGFWWDDWMCLVALVG